MRFLKTPSRQRYINIDRIDYIDICDSHEEMKVDLYIIENKHSIIIEGILARSALRFIDNLIKVKDGEIKEFSELLYGAA